MGLRSAPNRCPPCSPGPCGCLQAGRVAPTCLQRVRSSCCSRPRGGTGGREAPAGANAAGRVAGSRAACGSRASFSAPKVGPGRRRQRSNTRDGRRLPARHHAGHLPFPAPGFGREDKESEERGKDKEEEKGKEEKGKEENKKKKQQQQQETVGGFWDRLPEDRQPRGPQRLAQGEPGTSQSSHAEPSRGAPVQACPRRGASAAGGVVGRGAAEPRGAERAARRGGSRALQPVWKHLPELIPVPAGTGAGHGSRSVAAR
ncbi:uncharacterized protein LOC134147004 [Rhea pennata]|uniref:uncharacterized protein LOC134147004 n=1 Tax=Rhea pennata TaxID=8795 RepID=UPI002E26D59C